MQTPSLKNSPTRSRSRFAALVLLTFAAASAFATAALSPVATRDRKVIRRWVLPGDPRGVAVGADGTIYVGLADQQAVVAIDGATGSIRKRVVLDSAHIAATKELVTLRTNPARTRLYIANGSDESAMILSLPDLTVLREITMEGETIRDVVPDPRGRYVYVLGRRLHVFDQDGRTQLRTLNVDEPMAIAASAATLAVFATESFGTARATAVLLFDPKTFAQVARDPLQTTESIEGAIFAAGDRSLVAFSRDTLFERAVISRPKRVAGKTLDMGELVNMNRVCLPDGSGPQVMSAAGTDTLLVYAERRCSASDAFNASPRGITPASIYGVSAYAVAYDPRTSSIVATDRAGFLTIYHVPRPAVAK